MLAAVREQLGDEVELAPDRGLVLGLDPRADGEFAPRPAHGERPSEAERTILPTRHALVVEAQHELALGEHVDVHQPSARRPESLVETPAQPLDLGALRRLSGEEPVLRGRALVDPHEDLLRLAEHALRGHQNRDRGSAARAPGRDSVDGLDVALLAVWDSRPLEGPTRLLAVVADRNRDEPQHPGEDRSGLPPGPPTCVNVRS